MYFFLLSFLSLSIARGADSGIEVDALLAKVGGEAVLLSDLERFSDVDRVLRCAGLVKRDHPLAPGRKELLDAYIDEELYFQDARGKKIATAGQIPLAVQAIHGNPSCRAQWKRLGDRYGRVWRTENRPHEGEAMLVRELEKRVLAEKFRHQMLKTDPELWKRDASVRFPVKIFVE